MNRLWSVLTLLVVLCGCGSESPETLTIGTQAPDFSLPSLDGTEVASASLEGEVVVLNFWATWCQPCLREIPELQEIAAEGRAKVVGIALDEEGEAAVRPFVERHDIEYTILLGNQQIFRRFHGISIPYTLVLDPARQVVNIYRGRTTRADIELDLARLERNA